MRKIILCLGAALFFASCSDHETKLGEVVSPTMIEWVSPDWDGMTTVEWPDPETQYVYVDIPVRATGFEKDYDREFFITQSNLYDTSPWSAWNGRPGESYEPVDGVPFVLPAGEMETVARVKLLYDYPRINYMSENSYADPEWGDYYPTYGINFRFVMKEGEELIGSTGEVYLEVRVSADYGPSGPPPANLNDYYNNR